MSTNQQSNLTELHYKDVIFTPTTTCIYSYAALTSETKQPKTIPKQIQNNVLFQTLLHVKQNTETIPKRFGIVSELFWAH